MNPPTSSTSYLTASIAGVQVALPVSSVKEIVRAVALAIVPGAPRLLEGALNLRGTLVPVVDLRLRLGLPSRANDPSDSLIVLATNARLLAVRVESVDDVEEIDAASIANPSVISPVLAALPALAGIASRDDGALVIYDPATFLTQAEGEAIDVALKEAS
ncbi:MAG: chemotaxis protein CheW [bacterium]